MKYAYLLHLQPSGHQLYGTIKNLQILYVLVPQLMRLWLCHLPSEETLKRSSANDSLITKNRVITFLSYSWNFDPLVVTCSGKKCFCDTDFSMIAIHTTIQKFHNYALIQVKRRWWWASLIRQVWNQNNTVPLKILNHWGCSKIKWK